MKRRMGPLFACMMASALASSYAATALAQPNEPICIAEPNSAPRLPGAPRWLASDTHGGDPIHWLNDIRWSDAVLDKFDDFTNDAFYRVVYDGDHLLVSIQAFNSPDPRPKDVDRVYFAVGHPTNGRAVAVAIDLQQPSASATPNRPTAITLAETHLFSGGAWSETSGQFDPAPGWLVAPAVWVNEQRAPKICVNDLDMVNNSKACIDANNDGQADNNECGNRGGVCVANDPSKALWGVNFKIRLQSADPMKPAAQLPIGDPLKIFLGARLHADAVGTAPQINWTKRLCATKPCAPENAGLPAGDYLFDAAGDIRLAMVPKSMALWADASAPNQRCAGASLVRPKIGRQQTPNNYDMVDLRLASAAVNNKLIATLDCPNGCNPDSVRAKFRVANWGSTYNDKGWFPLTDSAGQQLISLDSAKHFTFNCQPNTAGSTCGVSNVGLSDKDGNGYYHQCTAVDLERGRDRSVAIGSASEYVNTKFEIASTIQRVATIDVRGMAAKLGNNNSRSILLYVKRKNMPAPTTRTLYLPRNEMMADRLEALDMYKCSSSNEDVSCVGLDGAVGVCAYPCSADGYCQEGDSHVEVADACLCAESDGQGVDVCYAGEPDRRDDRNVATDESRLERSWPTYTVLPFLDTGRNATLRGSTYRIVEPMAEFEMYIDHIGPHQGFTDSLVGLNGLAVTRLGPDVYRITVPNESNAKMRVTVTAQESQSVVPLTVLSGSSTNFGVFGTAEVVGISPALYPLDLRRGTARLDRLMSENGRELVRNLNAPRTMSPLPGALPTIATFMNTTGVDVMMEVIELPLLGRLTSTTAVAAAVDRPSTCVFGVGTAVLSTSFSINDTVNPVFATEARNDWACIPFVGMVAL